MSDELQKSKRRGRIARYAPLVFWIGLILFLSTEQASMSNTSTFIRPLLKILFPNASEEMLILYHGYVRKLAHVTVYAILAFWAARAFVNSSRKFLHQFWFICACVVVLLVASIDETNQSFLASRTGSIYDVLLDVGGGLAMIGFFYLMKYRNSRKDKPTSKL